MDYPYLPVSLSRNVSFVTTQELEDHVSRTSRRKSGRTRILKEHKTAFIMKIGDVLKSGHQARRAGAGLRRLDLERRHRVLERFAGLRV